jgi:hypothetical protein
VGATDRWTVGLKAGASMAPGTYRVVVEGGTLAGGAPAPAGAAVKVKVTASRPQITQSAKRVRLYASDPCSTATVRLTLPHGAAVKQVAPAGTGPFNVRYRGGELTVFFTGGRVDAETIKSGSVTLRIVLEGNEKPAATVKLGVDVKKF